MLEAIFQLSQRFLTEKNQPQQRDFLHTLPQAHPLVILIGQRGMGKTTLLIQHLLSKVAANVMDTRILYVQADHITISDVPLYTIAEEFEKLGGKYLAIDEIHKYPNWSQELKSIFDTFPKLNVIVSGSSLLEIYKGSHDLSRRALVFHLAGLSFREYLNLTFDYQFTSYSLENIIESHQTLCEEIINSLSYNKQRILPNFYNYLKVGYFPYYRLMESVDYYYLTLTQNVSTTIESDVLAVYPHLAGHSIKKIKRLMTFIAKSVPFTPNWQALKTLIEVGDTRTIKTYFKYLEDSSLIITLTSASKKMKKFLSPEKIYLNNTNQLYAVAESDPNVGTLRETFFMSMLSNQHRIELAITGDFLVNDTVFEVGGNNKDFKQIKQYDKAFLALDKIEHGFGKKIPLWLFGFVY